MVCEVHNDLSLKAQAAIVLTTMEIDGLDCYL